MAGVNDYQAGYDRGGVCPNPGIDSISIEIFDLYKIAIETVTTLEPNLHPFVAIIRANKAVIELIPQVDKTALLKAVEMVCKEYV